MTVAESWTIFWVLSVILGIDTVAIGYLLFKAQIKPSPTPLQKAQTNLAAAQAALAAAQKAAASVAPTTATVIATPTAS